jgi:amino acid adenylation domain-containing protein
MNLSTKIFTSAKNNQDLFALKIDDKRYTYSELTTTSLKIASILSTSNTNNSAIGIVGQRNLFVYVGILGVIYSGNHYVPINTKTATDKILAIIKSARIKIFIGSIDDLNFIEETLDRDNFKDWQPEYITENSQIHKSNNWLFYNKIDASLTLTKPVQSSEVDLAYILFTSGSTGTPKGVKVSRGNISAYLAAISILWNLPTGYRASQFHDLTFDPSVSDLFVTWTNAGELCVVPEKEMFSPYNFIRREEIYLWSSVPSIGIFMSKLGFLSNDVFPSIRITRFAGEPLSKNLADEWQSAAPNSLIENHYGPTEATIDVCRHIYTPDQIYHQFSQNTIPIGNAFPNMQIRIIDKDDLPLPDGTTGQIVFKGPQISQGYLNDEQRTNTSFVKFGWDNTNDIWYKSGDIGFINANGSLECLGRNDNQIKYLGKRIELGEIESILSFYPPLKGIVVIPIKDFVGIVKELVGFIIGSVSDEELSFIKTDSLIKLDKDFFPKRIICLDKLPRSISGKVDRNELTRLAVF